ncbi:MAG: SipW-dependent-type signal peptide-containing protein [Clostridia bacterium]|nr:SipW-dependent-type signal peptide-containing protein [Clostridia bacterium]
MKKLRTILLMGLAAIIAVSSAIGGTLAYLTDTESAVNVMTVGSVKIEQHEYQRAEGVAHKNTVDAPAKEGDLVPYVQDQMLLPAVPSGDYPYTAEPSDLFYWGYYTDGNGGNGLWDDSKLKNVIDKMVFVENKGNTDAYFRTLIAFECPEELTVGDAGTGDDIGINVNSGYEASSEACYIDIDGVRYDVRCFTYGNWNDGILSSGETARPSLLQIVLNHKATNEDVALFGEKYDVHVISQAVQADGFADAETALNEAFGAFEVNNVAEWFGGKEYIKKWSGTADISWYNDVDTEFTLTTSEQLAGLADLVDAGNTFEGKTITLTGNVDLYAEDENGEPVSFEPIGCFSENKAFEGTFDGQGHTIFNLYQNGWALANGYWDGPEYGMGFFGLLENATVKNVNFENPSLPTEANIIGVVAGGVANCVLENINITGAYLGNHSWYSGGVVGWAEGDVKLVNCDIDETSVVSSQWGDFNNANGGLIGGIDPASTIYLKDCDVACVIDAYNDVTSAYEWYSYRSCGMLIGDTGQMDDPDGNNVGDAIAPNVTCENVTVTYGDWANYHYCEFGSSNYPFCRVEAGESTGAYGNARVGEYTDANGNKVVDDNHVHNSGEKHNELIVFDQLYGGESGDRYCTYGTATHPGVTVVYNNK